MLLSEKNKDGTQETAISPLVVALVLYLKRGFRSGFAVLLTHDKSIKMVLKMETLLWALHAFLLTK
ncbi:MAG: hypothetical protein DMF73_09095 [Acidobacteria bacterium]|nr:MAG: hypothetical protein DMF73_09095 [Acidobacteriota bacterium]